MLKRSWTHIFFGYLVPSHDFKTTNNNKQNNNNNNKTHKQNDTKKRKKKKRIKLQGVSDCAGFEIGYNTKRYNSIASTPKKAFTRFLDWLSSVTRLPGFWTDFHLYPEERVYLVSGLTFTSNTFTRFLDWLSPVHIYQVSGLTFTSTRQNTFTMFMDWLSPVTHLPGFWTDFHQPGRTRLWTVFHQ